MSSKRFILLAGLIVAAVVLAFVSSGAALSQELMRVFVVNLATPHPIEGAVSVVGTIRHSNTIRVEDLLVASARREDTARWTDAGLVETDGFTSLVLSVQGYVKGRVNQQGSIGVILIPEEEVVIQALSEGQIQLPLELTTEVTPGGTSYFNASAPGLSIAFPRYRVWLYNTTDESAAANVFLYLTN